MSIYSRSQWTDEEADKLAAEKSDECLSEARKIIEIVYAYGEVADPGAAWDVLGREMFK